MITYPVVRALRAGLGLWIHGALCWGRKVCGGDSECEVLLVAILKLQNEMIVA
jgi:hypothetical protein